MNTHRIQSFKQLLQTSMCSTECLLAKLNMTLFTYSRILRIVYKKRTLNNCMGIRVNSNSSNVNDRGENCTWTHRTKCNSGRGWRGGQSRQAQGWLHIYMTYFKSPISKSKHTKITSYYFIWNNECLIF